MPRLRGAVAASAFGVAVSCMITCYGGANGKPSDGVGHQMEAKLTCIGTAAALNLTYVHVPITAAQHAQHARHSETMEEFFGLSTEFPSAPSKDAVPRKPLAWVNHCKDPEWWDAATRCPRDDVVYAADNCFDFFWCRIGEPAVLRAWREDALPRIRRAYFATPKSPTRFDPAHLNVALHVRRDDGMGTPSRVFKAIIDDIRASPRAARRPARFYVHTDARDHAAVHEELGGGPDVVVAGREFPLREAVHEMVSSDVFVMSKSTLSHVAAMISQNATIVYPENSRINFEHLGWLATLPRDLRAT